MFLLTYHTLLELYPDNPNIGIIADISQLLVYIVAAYIAFKCKHPSTLHVMARAIFIAFALVLPEVFFTYAILCYLLNIKRKICCMSASS